MALVMGGQKSPFWRKNVCVYEPNRTSKDCALLFEALVLTRAQLGLLRALILWALQSSEAIQALLKTGYKPTLHGRERVSVFDVQPWGQDTWKRRFFLIEGRDDTHFRLYRQSNLEMKSDTWWSVAGTIDELKAVANSLGEEKARSPKDLSRKLLENIPRFEGSEEVSPPV